MGDIKRLYNEKVILRQFLNIEKNISHLSELPFLEILRKTSYIDMIDTKKYFVLALILHQWLFITSATPSPSNPKDLADILSLPSGNIRPGMLNWNRYNNLNGNPHKQDGNSNKTEIGGN